MEFYQRGNWAVSTPLWVLDDQTMEDRMSMMVCPHPQWKEVNRQVIENPEDGIKYLTITEKCQACGALRMRLLPEGVPEEPFDYSIPEKGPWYERLYNLGNFIILVRRYQENEEVPPTFMTRVETPQGNVHTGMIQMPTLLFAPAAVDLMKNMETVVKLGPKRYAEYRILREKRRTKREKDDIREHGDSLYRVAQDIGPESFAAAKALLEAEIDHESVEMEEYQIQAMEREIQHRRAAQKKRSQKPL